VDDCETDRQAAFDVNAEGAANVARGCRETGARMVYVSTDYVFDGTKGSPYMETDPTGPINVYGESKLAGENAVAEILPEAVLARVSWLYGDHPRGAVAAILRSARALPEGEPLLMPDDQTSCPTWTREVARQLVPVVSEGLSGVVHVVAGGGATRYEFAQAILEQLGLPVRVEACSVDDLGRAAPRPKDSRLANARLQQAGLDRMASWRESLRAFLDQYGDGLTHEVQD
jgi:dTDP-4-dehydrorhamnose reductase